MSFHYLMPFLKAIIYLKESVLEATMVATAAADRFIATEVQEYFRGKNIKQEFTKPATPQQDAHIEAYHSIMESCICQRFEFNDLNEARKTLEEFRSFYDFERIHGGINFQSPYKYLLKYDIDMKK